MPGFETLIDRLISYMHYSGQDLFMYPGVWYHGPFYPSPSQGTAMQRRHPHNFMEYLLLRFEAEGIGLLPTINLHSLPSLAHYKWRDEMNCYGGGGRRPIVGGLGRQPQLERMARHAAELQYHASGSPERRAGDDRRNARPLRRLACVRGRLFPISPSTACFGSATWKAATMTTVWTPSSKIPMSASPWRTTIPVGPQNAIVGSWQMLASRGSTGGVVCFVRSTARLPNGWRRNVPICDSCWPCIGPSFAMWFRNRAPLARGISCGRSTAKAASTRRCTPICRT